jgi:hypothetical protein
LTSHGQPWIHNTHHSPDSRETTTFPQYCILCTTPREWHPNGFLSQDSQMGVPKLPRLGAVQLCGTITFGVDLRSRRGLNQSCSPCQELSNSMLHATCTQGNLVDSRLPVVGSQIVNLIPGLSFGHNLCCRCPNGSCEPILDIYTSIAFQWYKEILNARYFYPCNWTLNFWESQRTPKSPFRECEFHPHTFSK